MDRATLLRAFEITEQDLEVNRAGELTDRQRQAIRKFADDDATFMVGFAVVLAVVMYGIGGYLFHDGRVFRVEDGSDALGVAGIVFGTVLLPTAGIAWAGYTAWIASKVRGRLTVTSVEGVVTTRRFAHRQTEVFDLLIADRRFDIGPAAFEVLASGARYRLYVVPEIGAVIAAEPVS